MAAIELYNHTVYPDDVILDICKYAKRKMQVRSDVAVKVMYRSNSNCYLGLEVGSIPTFDQMAGRAKKKFAHKNHKGFATKGKDVGYIVIYLTKPKNAENFVVSGQSGYDEFQRRVKEQMSAELLDTVLHEMGHIWQDRNREAACVDYGISTWRAFNGYTSKYSSKRTNYMRRPIEIHVRKMIKRVAPTSTAARRRVKEILDNISNMYMSKVEIKGE